MLILIRMLSGQHHHLDVEPYNTIREVKQMLVDLTGIPVDVQRLIFGGLTLEDERTLADYSLGIRRECTLHMVPRMPRLHRHSDSASDYSQQNNDAEGNDVNNEAPSRNVAVELEQSG